VPAMTKIEFRDEDAAKPGNDQLLLHNVLASMPVGVAWADPVSGRIEFVNRKFTNLFGYTIDDLTTIHEWIVKCYANPEQAKTIDAFWQSKMQGLANVEVEDVELDILCKDGSIKTVLSGKILLPHHSGALATFLDITPRKERESLIRKQAMEDVLTGLLNRRAFTQILDRNLRGCHDLGGKMALMLIDLDGFKPVNDTLGHDQGDMLLIKVAERLKHAVRENDALCRIGGDEFGVVLNHVNDEETATAVADRILYGLTRRPYDLGGKSMSISASIGIALFPEDGLTERNLFKHADEALYRAKNSGKGKWCR
jgi:diguanylate cyclase (GGDEF)-like protein/PAS domain S-box-containing protein